MNLENDIVGKYVQSLLGINKETEATGSHGITMEFLAQHGF